MKRGFTLIEMLVVIVILGILIGLGSKGFRAAKINAKRAQARVEMSSIETAVKAYQSKYGKLPASDSYQGRSDTPDSETLSRDTIAILSAQNEDENPAEMVFLQPQDSATDGTFLDPWGTQYLIVLDTDYDGQVQIRNHTLRRNVAVISTGLYYLNNDYDADDLIFSWE
ncbi:prepilin-type N-terminal cleavage/methylation domain-containing protein [Pontiellaceae bacterium B1224]|nr:prepilin-type N-terminal cleavage/methylation domain-containing protein [Pontiellaceae bacterium B1224]